MTRDFTELFCFVNDFIKAFDEHIKSINSCKSKSKPATNLNGFPINAFVHMIAQLVNYQLPDNKPSIKNLLQIHA